MDSMQIGTQQEFVLMNQLIQFAKHHGQVQVTDLI